MNFSPLRWFLRKQAPSEGKPAPASEPAPAASPGTEAKAGPEVALEADSRPKTEVKAQPEVPHQMTLPSAPEPEPLPATAGEPGVVPGTGLRYVPFTQPPMSPYAYASHCYEKTTETALAQELKRLGPSVFMLVAVDETRVVIQAHEHACKLNRASIREISLHPVLPAKGAGMVMLFFELYHNGQYESHDFLMCSCYSEALKDWCQKKGQEVARLLNVSFNVTTPSHDC